MRPFVLSARMITAVARFAMRASVVTIAIATGTVVTGATGCGEDGENSKKPSPNRSTADVPSQVKAQEPLTLPAETQTSKQPSQALVPANPPSASLWTRRRGTDWPRFLGPTFDGKSTEAGIRTDWSDGKLPVLWSMDLGTSYGIGAVAEGRYFQHDRIANVETLTAVNAETGQKLWREDHPVDYTDMYGYNNGPRGTAAVDDDDVFTFGVAGRLSCHSAATGSTKWTIDTNTAYGVIQNFFGVGTSPLIWGDTVMVMVGGSPDEDQAIAPGRLDRVSPNGSALVAFDRKTGKERWKVGDDLASYSSPRLMKIGDKSIVLLLARGGLLAVDPDTGKQLWYYPHRAEILESVNGMVPLVMGNRVFISDCYELGSAWLEVSADGYKLIAKDSDNRREQLFRAHWATPIAVGEFIYGCSGRNEPDSDLRCIHATDRVLQWSDQRRSRTSVLYVDNHFVVLDESGLMQLIRVDSNNLSIVTSIDLESDREDHAELGQPYWAAPILSHGLLYVRGSHRVQCFELIADDRD